MDRIDLKLLKLLQQRTKLSAAIGRTKRRHGAEIYVPGRERELIARVIGHANGHLTPTAITAVFREILSSSRAVQGQAPIGMLRSSAPEILLAARGHFGSCDRLVIRERWRELARELEAGELAAALLTLDDLAALPRDQKSWREFFATVSVVGEFVRDPDGKRSLANRVFIVKARDKGRVAAGNRLLILIECKITAVAVKSLLNLMPNRPIHAELAVLPAVKGSRRQPASLLAVTLSKTADEYDAVRTLPVLDHPTMTISIAGIYPASEGYGG